MSTLHSDDTFDRAMRDSYRQAVQHVSPATRMQLRANSHAATRGESIPARGWRFGAAFGGVAAIVFAITVGLNFNRLDFNQPGWNADGTPQAGPQAASDMLATAADDLPMVTALDQDPDFYAWLASPDAQLMAME